MKTRIIIATLLIALAGCDKTITIGTPKAKPGDPVRKEYVVLRPGWEENLPIAEYVQLTDKALVDLYFKIDSLESVITNLKNK